MFKPGDIVKHKADVKKWATDTYVIYAVASGENLDGTKENLIFIDSPRGRGWVASCLYDIYSEKD